MPTWQDYAIPIVALAWGVVLVPLMAARGELLACQQVAVGMAAAGCRLGFLIARRDAK